MNPGRRRLPSPESIRAFHSGRLPGPDMEALADHLGVCTACAAAFDGLEDDGVDFRAPPVPAGTDAGPRPGV